MALTFTVGGNEALNEMVVCDADVICFEGNVVLDWSI